MYSKRIRIFVVFCAALGLICLIRLTQMQLRSDSFYRGKISELKLQRGHSRQLKTIRGKILDRKGRVLATDEPQFQLHVNYRLTRYYDERDQKAKLLRAAKRKDPDSASAELRRQLQSALEDLQRVIDKCVQFGLERQVIEERIERINDRIWNLRSFLAWRRNVSAPDVLEKYNNEIESIPLSEAIADFEEKFPQEDKRLLLINKVDDIAEMDKDWPLLELRTDDDIFAAQLEFLDIDGVKILPQPQRFYHYGSVAAQTIGWVGLAKTVVERNFKDDRLSSYLEDELSGQEDGVEYVCEAILRGRRGELLYDIDRRLVSRTKTRFGKNVSLTLDIELQQRIEDYLADCSLNSNCQAPSAAVVIDVNQGDILALVSTPTFDLNRARYDYDILINDSSEPLRNRAINKQYPPGSVVKPLILIAALESSKITAEEIISCPARAAPKGWPNCWLYNRYSWTGHDDKGPNNARNALKGSCNIYFSRVANRINPVVLQRWLFDFGYGRQFPLAPDEVKQTKLNRNLRQAQGHISSSPLNTKLTRFEQLLPLQEGERRYFGIGQGNLRVNPLQVANAFAAIARGGVFKFPRLFINDPNNPAVENRQSEIGKVSLDISRQSLDVIRDGTRAVVNEYGGTAYNEFAHAGFAEQGIVVYGKTGSTERPDNAWFAGFAEDYTGRGIAIAVLVEGGQHGSSDAGPLAREIIQFCIDAGYLGGN